MKKIEENKVIDKKDLKELRIEILDYAKERIDIEVENSLKKVEKKIVKRKNIKIIKRDIMIVLLLVLCSFLTYELYDMGFFNKYLVKETANKTESEEKQDKQDEVIIKEDLKEKHKHALDNISIKSNSKYINDYYNGNLTNELKLELTLNLIPLDKIENDEENYLIDNSTMEEYFNKLFNSSYKASSFSYGSNKVKYLKKQEVYLASDEITKNESKIKKIITDVQENDDEIIISTIEYIVDNNKVINILTQEEILDNENEVLKNKDKLTKLDYYLTIRDNSYRLNKIVKK